MLLNVERLREQLKVSEEELKLSKQLYEHEFAEKNDKIQHLNMQLESALTDVDIIRKDVSFNISYILLLSKLMKTFCI